MMLAHSHGAGIYPRPIHGVVCRPDAYSPVHYGKVFSYAPDVLRQDCFLLYRVRRGFFAPGFFPACNLLRHVCCTTGKKVNRNYVDMKTDGHTASPEHPRSNTSAYRTQAGRQKGSKWRNDVISLFNGLVLLGSVLVIMGLSIEVFHDSQQLYHQRYMQLQFWVCIVFLLDFFIRFFLNSNKWKFLASNFIFLLVSIPYLQIFSALNIPLSKEIEYMLRLMPLIRGGYGLAIMVGWITSNRTTSLMVSYVLMLLALVYFASLVFFSLEHAINPKLASFGDSLSWAFMNVTTVGSNISPMTATGKVLAVVLAASGMMMFPIFTVYITSRFQSHWAKGGNDKHQDRSTDDKD